MSGDFIRFSFTPTIDATELNSDDPAPDLPLSARPLESSMGAFSPRDRYVELSGFSLIAFDLAEVLFR
jgi:hypothetical protein